MNFAGQMVQTVWDDLSTIYPSVETDLAVVMPNHFHGVIVLVGAGPLCLPCIRRATTGGCPYTNPIRQ